MSLDVPTDIDERGANYHAWCVVCRLRETVCTCYEISNGQLRGRCESVPHSAAVPCLAEAQHKPEQGKRQQDTWARGCRAWPNCGCGSLRSCQWREIRRRETERDRPARPAPDEFETQRPGAKASAEESRAQHAGADGCVKRGDMVSWIGGIAHSDGCRIGVRAGVGAMHLPVPTMASGDPDSDGQRKCCDTSERNEAPAGTHKTTPAPYESKREVQQEPRSWCWWCVNAPTDSGACRWHSNSTSSGVGTDTRIDCTQTSRHRGCDPDKRSSYVVVAQQTTQLPGAGNTAGLDVDPFPPRTASPCRSEAHCGDPSHGLWRDCSVALGAGDFL